MTIEGKKNKKRTSKRGKKLWRNVDVTDYVDGLKLSETTNSDLFVIDKTKKKKIEVLSHSARKEKVKNKVLHQDAILAPNDPKAKVDPEKNNSTIIKRFEKQIKKTEKKPETITKKTEDKAEVYDIWGVPKQELVKTPKIYEKRVPAKVLPSRLAEEIAAGQSYHPTTEDHQKLLGEALNQLEKKQNKQDIIHKKLSYPAHLRNESKDMEVKLQFSDDEDEQEEEIEEDEQIKREREIRKHYSMKFTKTQLNKKRRIRVEMAIRRRKLAHKRRMADIDRIPVFEQLIKKREEQAKEKEEKRKQIQEVKKSQPDRLGKYALEEQPVDFLYSDELPSSLRTLKSTGNIAVDIYKDLQKRNILEPRVRVIKRERRYRLKQRQTRDAKEWEYHFNKSLAE